MMMAVTCFPWNSLKLAQDAISNLGYTPCHIVAIIDSGQHLSYKILFSVENTQDKLAAILKFPPNCIEEFHEELHV